MKYEYVTASIQLSCLSMRTDQNKDRWMGCCNTGNQGKKEKMQMVCVMEQRNME